MTTSRLYYSILIVGILISILPAKSFSDKLYAPDYLWQKGIADKFDPVQVADTHLGIPYRDDGAIDDQGRFTTFAHPDHFFDTPGLNCSGLVLSISRFLFDRNWTLAEATRDRQNNSGPGAPLGKDWDFGFDLIQNLTDGVEHRVIMPDGKPVDLSKEDGLSFRGFRLDDRNAWMKVIRQMKPGYAYLGDISKPTRAPGYKLVHYHVVIAIPDKDGAIWLYHATRRSNVHKMNINTPQGLAKFMGQFHGSRGDVKHILFIEAKLPDLEAATQEPPSAQTPANNYQPPAAVPPAPTQPQPAPAPTSKPEASVPSAENRAEPVTPPPTPETQKPPSVTKKAQEPSPPPKPSGPNLELAHLAGKVYNRIPDIVTHIPKFSDQSKTGFTLLFQNRANNPRPLDILMKTPFGDYRYQGTVPAGNNDFEVLFPRDFGIERSGDAAPGQYVEEVTLDGKPWIANVFQVDKPREAEPKIISVKVPREVQAGRTFTVSVSAENKGAESDYGGITVSSPNPGGLRIVSCRPGRVFPAGSSVLSITTDKIRTKVPMAEQWIELWGENKIYDMVVTIRAGRPGTYPLYVRCAIRGVNVKSSVILMDPPSGDTVDQQGFPVKVYNIEVR
ncbi:MAG: hypothetical protein ACP5U1_03065 [Desulfomonilaceae bacterium]